MKPWAIVGTGPCLSDVWDFSALRESRTVLAINQAIDRVSHPEVALLADPTAVARLLRIAHPPTIVLASLRALAPPYGMETQAIVALDDYWPKVWCQFVSSGSLPCALGWLREQRVEHVEIYGIDLLGEDQWPYQSQIDFLRDARYRKLIPQHIVNCCPSSRWLDYPFQERPWTKKR